MTARSITRCYGCPHESVSPQPAACPLSVNIDGGSNKLSRQMRQIQACVEAQVNKIERTLRRTWIFLGGIFLPTVAAVAYALAFIK